MPERHATRGRNMSRGDGSSATAVRSIAEIELDLFLQEAVLPLLGQHKYGKLIELVDAYGVAHYGRGYMQGGRDERHA